MIIENAKRVFMYNGITLPDPGPDLDEKGVVEYYSAAYPELTTASIGQPEVAVKDGKTIVTFKIGQRTGEKG